MGSWVWTIEQDGTGADIPSDGDTTWVTDGTSYGDRSSLGATTNTIDGITVAVGTRVLVKDSATASQDYKIYSASGSISSDCLVTENSFELVST